MKRIFTRAVKLFAANTSESRLSTKQHLKEESLKQQQLPDEQLGTEQRPKNKQLHKKEGFWATLEKFLPFVRDRILIA